MKLKLDIDKMKYETYYNLLDEFRTELKEKRRESFRLSL